MVIENIELGQLRALDMLLRERNVTRAAQRLHLSQSALSHSLGRLREITGDPLFVRTPRGMTPTPRAAELAPEVSAILQRIERMFEPTELDLAKLERTFVICAQDFIELRIARALIPRLAREAPGVDMLIRPELALSEEDLAAGRADLIIGVLVPQTAGVMHKKLADEGFLTLARRNHPVVKRRLTLAQFVALRHIQIAPRGLPGGPVDDALAALGLSRRVVLRVPSFLPAIRMASTTDLLLTAPEELVRDAIKNTPLVAHPTPVDARPFRITMAWHERSQKDPAHAWLRDRITEQLAR